MENKRMQDQIEKSLKLLKKVLGPDLLGVYLYGSSVLGGLQKYSDVDLFCVIARKTKLEEKQKLIEGLLQISGIYMVGPDYPLEITLVVKDEINPWQYPPRYDFQYGEWLRDSFEKGFIPLGNEEMLDLAVIVSQVLLRCQTLFGKTPEELLEPVPPQDFMQAMVHDVERLSGDLEGDTRNVLLTLARIWCTLETFTIVSKPFAAEWAKERLPREYRPVLNRARLICIGAETEHWEDLEKALKPCATFMRDQIKDIYSADFKKENRSIQLSE